jgi:hypothetical protein
MAQIIGFEKSDFDIKKFDKIFGKNNGDIITDDGNLQGWEEVKKILDDEVFKEIKKSPYYIKGLDNVE